MPCAGTFWKIPAERSLNWDSVGLLQGSKGLSRKKSEKGFPGLSAPGSKKLEKLKKS